MAALDSPSEFSVNSVSVIMTSVNTESQPKGSMNPENFLWICPFTQACHLNCTRQKYEPKYSFINELRLGFEGAVLNIINF
jgi:hypothetical protein